MPDCNYCLTQCNVYPNGNITNINSAMYTKRQGCSVFNSRRKKIWNQSRMSSSQALFHKRGLLVNKMVGQSAYPKKLLQAGGPGDLQKAIQKITPMRSCYSMGHLRNRVANKNNSGVDRKHGSYHRYLARRVGGVLRKEKTKAVMMNTASVGQPRSRTNTTSCCKRETTSNFASICVKDECCGDERINLKQIKDHDYRLKKDDGTMDFGVNTLIVTDDTSAYDPNWYSATTILNWNKNLQIPTKGTHIVRDSRFKDGNSNVKATLEPYIIKEYLSLMGGDICQWVPRPSGGFSGTLYIRKSQSPNRYWLLPTTTSWAYIIYYDHSKIQELFGVDNHESIKKPHR